MLALLLAGLVADLAGGARTPKPLKVPEHVVIRSDHGGWWSEHRELTIARGPNGFSDGVRPIDERLLLALVASATATPTPTLPVDRLGIDQAELRRQAERVARANFPPPAAAVVAERICDPKNLAKLAANLDGNLGSTTDDYPAVEVDLTLSDGEKVTLRSTAQPPLMLPWTIIRRGKTAVSFDPAISRAIAALLPPEFKNRRRLAGGGLEAFVAEFSLSIVAEGIAPRSR
jgi:hypothetical protein